MATTRSRGRGETNECDLLGAEMVSCEALPFGVQRPSLLSP